MISLRPQSIDFQSSWEANCKSQLKSLFDANSISEKHLSAIKLYSNIYELCISFPENHTMPLLKNIAQLFFDSAAEMRQNIIGIHAGALGSEALIELYVKEWNRYCVAFKAINGVCRYLNKCLRSNYETAQFSGPNSVGNSAPGLHFQPVLIQLGSSKSERFELKITGIEDVAKNVWNNLIILYFREKQGNSLIKNFLSVLRISNGNRENLKTFIESFRWCNDLSLIAMVEEDTKEYYAKLSQQFIQNNSTSTYVLFASEELSKESNRTNYLWESDHEAIKIIMRICENELIENHKDKLQEEFENMLQFGRASDLNFLFKLLGKNEGTILALQNSLSRLILKDFDCAYNSANTSSNEAIMSIMEVHQKYTKFINSAFDNEHSMVITLEDAIAQIINQRIKNSWILFSNLIDELLRSKNSITEEIVAIIKLFTLRTESFDDFIDEYKERLSQRIVFHGIDIDSEENVMKIFKSAEKLSPEQNCHLNRMLLDYKEKLESILVLTSHAWPPSCNPIKIDESTIPGSLKELMQEFEDEYRGIHCGRKIQWCPQLITLEAENGTLMTMLQYQLIHALPFEGNLTAIAQKLNASMDDFSSALKILQEREIIKHDNLSGICNFLNLPSNLNLIPVKNHVVGHDHIALGNFSNDNSKLAMEVDSSRQVRQSFIIQSLITMILKRQRHSSPAEMKKLLISAASTLKHGHAFVPQADEVDAAINGLIGKGYLEFNEQENLFIYVP